MRGEAEGVHGDDTFNDVVRDFSQLAYSHPERLHRGPNGDLPPPLPDVPPPLPNVPPPDEASAD